MLITYFRLKNKHNLLQIFLSSLTLLFLLSGCSTNEKASEEESAKTTNKEYSAIEAYLSEEKNEKNDINYLEAFTDLINNGVITLNKIVNYMETEGVERFNRSVVVEMLEPFENDLSKFLNSGYDGWNETIESLLLNLRESPYITYLYVTASQSNQRIYDNEEIYNHALNAKSDLEFIENKLEDIDSK